jgi:ribonuclease HII
VIVPGLGSERKLWAKGLHAVAGIDEAGRGAWAGPVVAAAVVLPRGDRYLLRTLLGVRDSKTLSSRQRERLFPLIVSTASAVGVGMASARFIDRMGIVAATRQAMEMAVANLGLTPDHLLIDALRLELQVPQTALIKGDATVLSIAAASIIAKVFRDRLLVALAESYPCYGFAAHKGYGTAAHRAALMAAGPCPEHRLSFAPLRGL